MTDDVWPSRLAGQHPVNPDTADMFRNMMRPPDRLPHPETEAADMVDPADRGTRWVAP